MKKTEVEEMNVIDKKKLAKEIEKFLNEKGVSKRNMRKVCICLYNQLTKSLKQNNIKEVHEPKKVKKQAKKVKNTQEDVIVESDTEVENWEQI